MNEKNLQKSRYAMVIKITTLVAMVVCFGMFFMSLIYFLGQDKIWKWRVRRQINFEETRTWAIGVLKIADPQGSYTNHRDFLTNAPAYLLKKNYKRNPDIVIRFECVHLRYGGGMQDWGLTIGNTNLPPDSALRSNPEEWAPGIYYWNN